MTGHPSETEVRELREWYARPEDGDGQHMTTGGDDERVVALCDSWLAQKEWIDSNSSLQTEMATELDALQRERERLQAALFDCYVEAGADTDGATTLAGMGKLTPGIDVLAVRAVKELRADHDEMLTGWEPLS